MRTMGETPLRSTLVARWLRLCAAVLVLVGCGAPPETTAVEGSRLTLPSAEAGFVQGTGWYPNGQSGALRAGYSGGQPVFTYLRFPLLEPVPANASIASA